MDEPRSEVDPALEADEPALEAEALKLSARPAQGKAKTAAKTREKAAEEIKREEVMRQKKNRVFSGKGRKRRIFCRKLTGERFEKGGERSEKP